MLTHSLPAPVVAFEGSRHLAPGLLPVGQLVAAVVAAGGRVVTGCCVGADAQVITAALAQGAAPSLSVFAQFGPGGLGAIGLSCVPQVLAAAAAGARVSWLAGGPLSVPVRARLARRAAALVSSAGALVLLAPGAGTLAAAVPVAVRRRLPVFSFSPAAPAVAGLAWSAGSFCGLPCWAWSPAPAVVQSSFFA